jgi:Uma2 family endonuclease
MSPVTQLITAEQLLRMPADGARYELVRGELKRMTLSGFSHGKVVVKLTAPLAFHVETNSLGVVLGAETGFRIAINPDTVRAPDIAFIKQERVRELGSTEKFWPAAPELAVEVLSPSDTVYEIEEKVAAWFTAGSLMVWVLNPKLRTIHIYRPSRPTQKLNENDTLDGGEVVPEFRIKVSEIFS